MNKSKYLAFLLVPVLSLSIARVSASGSWCPTQSMIVARTRHTATLLPNGKVLVAGGLNASNTATATAELYDPSSETWSLTAEMAAPRSRQTATLLPPSERVTHLPS